MAAEVGVDPVALAQVRAIVAGLPQTHEEPAWVGVRWKVRSRTIAHLLTIDGGMPATHARAAGTDGPATVITFRTPPEELDLFLHGGLPYFHGGWGRDQVGMVLDATTDWTELAELLTESYCVLAPATLVAQVPGRTVDPRGGRS